jgi:crotonobetainyl-CoA:carnitine CoA-transferase CaiB-like acyl-CoA transferase
MSEYALEHLRVIELTEDRAGSYCGKLLAGFGAEVIKVEHTRSRLRTLGPFFENRPGPERSIPQLWLDTGKKSVTLDCWTAPEDRATLRQLLGQADLFVTDRLLLRHLGLDYDSVRSLNARLIMVAISNFGLTGPYCNYFAEEITAQAMSGLMYVTGDPARAPLAARPAVASYTAGMHAYIGALIALFQRETTGEGQLVDVSIQESAPENIELLLAARLHGGPIAKRNNDNHIAVPWQLHPCRDGQVAVVGGPVRHWLPAVDLFEEPRLSEERFRHMSGRMKHREEVWSLLAPWLMRHDKKEIYHAGQKRRLAFGYVAGLAEVLASEQLNNRGFFVGIDHPVVGKHKYCDAPFRSAAMPWRSARAPLLGEHSGDLAAVLAPRGPHAVQAPRLNEGPPLKGIRIVDLTHDWAGPHATRLLADFGAEVIKIEYARRMEMMRGGVKENHAYNRHPRWHQLNRNKRSITLDLKKTRDVEIVRDLVRISDVLVENSRPGVMAGFGLDHESLRALQPGLIYLSMSAFGQSGPEAGYAGYGAALEALGGVQALTSYDAQTKPYRIKEMDVTNGILGACALVTALVHRQRTGQEQHIDLSQQETAIHGLIGEFLLEHAMHGTQPTPLGNRHPVWAPHGCYRCAGDDKWVAIAVCSDDEWRRLCSVIGKPELRQDRRFDFQAGRLGHHDELDRIIEQWTSQRSHYQAMHELQRAGIVAGAVLSTEELSNDPHLRERGYFVTGQDGKRYPGVPFRLSAARNEVWRRGPDLGEDQEYVLCQLLGRSMEEIEPLKAEQIGTSFDID